MMDIKISKMELTDFENIKDQLETDFDEFWSSNNLLSEIENQRSYVIKAKLNEEILGFAGIIDTVDQEEITNIVVKKSYRNKGIGSILLESLIEYAKSNNKEKIYLEVNCKNSFAIKLYEKYGFKECGLRKKYYNNTDDAILMFLQI